LGRPSKSSELRLADTLRQSGLKVIGSEEDPFSVLWESIWKQALSGSFPHQKAILDFYYGKPRHSVSVENEPVTFVFTKAES
jgi:hypothetical protein